MEFEKIAVVGEPELVLGFKLIGIGDVFMEKGDSAVERLFGLIESKGYGLIMASESIRPHLQPASLKLIDTSLKPLVVFIPLPGENEEQESVEKLAQRVLGVDIQKLK